MRRLKKNILKHLPPKQRSLVEVHVDDDGARRELQEGATYNLVVLLVNIVAGASFRIVKQKSSPSDGIVCNQSRRCSRISAHDCRVQI